MTALDGVDDMATWRSNHNYLDAGLIYASGQYGMLSNPKNSSFGSELPWAR